jgi:fructokinase
VDDVLVVGEALVDIVVRADGGRDEHPGGSPANVSLGVARLGRDVSLLTRIGDDDRGVAVRRLLEGSGVGLVDGTVVQGPTSTATARLDGHGAARYDFDLDWRLPHEVVDRVLTRARALHTGSIAAILPPGRDAVLQLVRDARAGMTVTYDPNARPALMGDPVRARARVETLVALSDVVKVSDEDLSWLAPGEDPLDVVAAWHESGPGVVVLTRGEHGAAAVCAAGSLAVAAPKIQVVDTVGAGDAFMAALLDFLAGAGLLGADRRPALRAIGIGVVEELLRHAVRVAAVTCTRPGADPPTRTELAGLTL